MNITIVFDNNVFDNRLDPGHGFSCLIEFNQNTILFDTGSDSSILISNMKQLGINPLGIDSVILSHIHDDHTGGLAGLLKLNKSLTVYLLRSFPSSFKERIKALGVTIVEIVEYREIYSGLYTTGELGSYIKEQSLIINTKKGIVIITGCAHPGVLEIIKKSKYITSNRNVSLVIGGFHLPGESNGIIRSIIDSFTELGVAMVAPCHCSGKVTRRMFKEIYGLKYIESGVGKIITLP